MDALQAVREPLVVNFSVPPGLTDAEARHLIDTWYTVLAPHDFVYLGGTTFALNPPCPTAEAFRCTLPSWLSERVEIEVLSRVLQHRGEHASAPMAELEA